MLLCCNLQVPGHAQLNLVLNVGQQSQNRRAAEPPFALAAWKHRPAGCNCLHIQLFARCGGGSCSRTRCICSATGRSAFAAADTAFADPATRVLANCAPHNGTSSTTGSLGIGSNEESIGAAAFARVQHRQASRRESSSSNVSSSSSSTNSTSLSGVIPAAIKVDDTAVLSSAALAAVPAGTAAGLLPVECGDGNQDSSSSTSSSRQASRRRRQPCAVATVAASASAARQQPADCHLSSCSQQPATQPLSSAAAANQGPTADKQQQQQQQQLGMPASAFLDTSQLPINDRVQILRKHGAARRR